MTEFEKALTNIIDIQEQSLVVDGKKDEYMRGLYNGLLMALCMSTGDDYKPI